MQEIRLGSIGAGAMARALLGGIVRAGLADRRCCLAADISEAARQAFTEATGIAATDQPQDVLCQCDVILLAVKPQQMAAALTAIRDDIGPHHLCVSIAAGITTGRLERLLGERTRLVRVMPNTPALLGYGAAGVARGAMASADDLALVLRLMGAVGLAVEVAEGEMDAVTAVSGSGPAYFFRFVEGMIAAAMAQGLAPEVAAALVRQTILGAAMMLQDGGESPEALRRAVTSPGGTTEAALRVFDEGGLVELIDRAVDAARRRGQELGQAD